MMCTVWSSLVYWFGLSALLTLLTSTYLSIRFTLTNRRKHKFCHGRQKWLNLSILGALKCKMLLEFGRRHGNPRPFRNSVKPVLHNKRGTSCISLKRLSRRDYAALVFFKFLFFGINADENGAM